MDLPCYVDSGHFESKLDNMNAVFRTYFIVAVSLGQRKHSELTQSFFVTQQKSRQDTHRSVCMDSNISHLLKGFYVSGTNIYERYLHKALQQI